MVKHPRGWCVQAIIFDLHWSMIELTLPFRCYLLIRVLQRPYNAHDLMLKREGEGEKEKCEGGNFVCVCSVYGCVCVCVFVCMGVCVC